MSITYTPPTEVVHLYLADDLERIQELVANLSGAINQHALDPETPAMPATLDEVPDETPDERKIAAKAHDDFVTEAAERATKIRIQAMGRKKWRALKDEHPPRLVDDTDQPRVEDSIGFNTDSMADDLVPASIAPDQFESDDERDDFLDSLTDQDFNRIYSAAVRLNERGVNVPKAEASSLLAQMFDETLRSQEASD